MEYWSTVITEKSWEVLQKIRKKINFVLIGGWAVYLWAKSHKSKDIDIIIDYNELNKLKLKYNPKKNDSLKKYEIKIEDIDVEIYIPFYSRLPIIEHIKNYSSNIEGFKVANPIALLVLKQAAEMNRRDSKKGLKDRIDIIDLLLKCQINFAEYNQILQRENLVNFREELVGIITKFKDIKYLDFTPRQFKLKKEEIIKIIKKK
ncbi:hypothetical protein HYW99_01235 [Candidatus Woesearchaeota archaeon]|nr:hypothetical protein [Candidatus Woesearchaeota archaeon]